MDSRAIIKGKSIELNAEEISGAAEFHKNRIAFGDVLGEYRFNTNKLDDRDHQHWICEDYGLSVDEFESIIRGYMVDGEVYFYRGSDFRCVNEYEINLDNLYKVLEVYKENFASNEVNIYNGVHIGKVGERWLPKKKLITVKLE